MLTCCRCARTRLNKLAFCLALLIASPLLGQESSSLTQQAELPSKSSRSKQDAAKDAAKEAAAEKDDLQKAIADAGNDRAAMVRNLDAFLKKYPESSQRPQIYRAIVESSIQLRDFPRATEYAERIVALNPEDSAMTVLSIHCWISMAMRRGGGERFLIAGECWTCWSGVHREINRGGFRPKTGRKTGNATSRRFCWCGGSCIESWATLRVHRKIWRPATRNSRMEQPRRTWGKLRS